MKYIKEFDYELRHISGKKNDIADFLSRKYDNFQWDEPVLNKIKETIVSDRDLRFLSEIWERWAKTMDSKLKMTVAHRVQADDLTERMNREIIRILTKASTEYGENWSDIIPLIEFAMNSSMSKSTKMSPFQIVYGFNPPTPVNHFNSLTKTRIPMSNIKKIVRDNTRCSNQCSKVLQPRSW
ncbi:hypothetical protein DDB_G0294256 [Dictyostelium discoideum AX4]|uniref:Integrase catalytic domain-containing protein n=1 Tax=Dictyostelium discoideum TaxID=44689 RepID=Q54AR8_DICDI|nr:hypothetical protein DDB_G0294256 [Dictyostelium discoideum AX4]EAL60355.1 hypothetical protein DDB_G0294256 [Dictyostelium discoideum AX4]|eukprot:XP_628768.1 hypothetical protein DDB_G0294256 [Dictyostelium discoideum AX4]